MNIAIKSLAGAATVALLATSGANAAISWPTLNGHAGPAIIITLGVSGTTITAGPATGPYDGSDDTYIGVDNQSGAAVSSIDLAAASLPIFGFEGDGVCHYSSLLCNTAETSGYGALWNGIATSFSNISANKLTGTVNFSGALASGQQAFFTLEDPLNTASFTIPKVTTGGVPEPTSWALMLVGFFGLGGMVRRARRETAMTAA